MSNKLPDRGFVFWPVGTGDSTTIAIDKNTVVQVDLNHMVKADDDDDPCLPIIDELVRILPKKGGKPYLAVFVLTHPDTDHCRGYAELQKKVTIGELWFTPRVFTEYKADLGDDAKAFQTEAKRRVKATIKANGVAAAGDRVRIVGYDEILQEDEYKGFPKARLTIPGNAVSEIDGADVSASFRAFVHAPFKDDLANERNDSCVGLQVSLYDGDAVGRALLFGDLCHPTVKAIFDRSKGDDLQWNIFLAPHHCSKSVMFWAETDEDEEELQQEILDAIEKTAEPDGYVVVSSHTIPEKNEPGDNPPHAIAKEQYELIAPNGVLCTMEHPNSDNPTMMVFTMSSSGLSLSGEKPAKAADGADQLKADIEKARGGPEPSRDRVGFGTGR